MAVEQALVSTRNYLQLPKSPPLHSKIHSLTRNSPSSLPLRQIRLNFKTCWRLKCSLDYQSQVAYPKPSEISWKKELSNSANLIGVVGLPVEIKNLPSGKVVAWTRLAVKKSGKETSWINLTFWDELAHTAFQHVEKGHQIYVSGRLVSDVVENDGKQQTYYKVVVQQLNFVEKSPPSVGLDNRDVNFMKAGGKPGNVIAKNMGPIQELWQAFFANPTQWWDNRKKKRSRKYPDFKHKDTREALWVEGRNNPPWVKSQLAILDARMGSSNDQDARNHPNVVTADELLS